jgi:eukaryotic-like serine/threonine-protein kinase
VVPDPTNPGPPPDDTATAVVPALTDEEEEPPSKRRKWLWVLLILLLLALLIGAIFGLPKLLGSNDDGGNVSVPDVVREKLADARETIEAEGLEVTVSREPDDEVAKNRVISQDPAGGEFLDEGDEVHLVVSTGPRTVTVPDDLVGMNVKDARQALEDVGLDSEVERRPSDEDRGEVIETRPAGGEEVSPGRTVTLIVSSGFPEVPDVVGETEDDATDILEEAGFEVKVEEQETDEAEEGTVVSQSPPGGEEALPESTVTIFVAVAPDETTPTQPTSPTQSPTTPTVPTISLPTGDDDG